VGGEFLTTGAGVRAKDDRQRFWRQIRVSEKKQKKFFLGGRTKPWWDGGGLVGGSGGDRGGGAKSVISQCSKFSAAPAPPGRHERGGTFSGAQLFQKSE